MRKRIVIFLALLVMLALACNMASNASKTPQAPGNAQQDSGNQPGEPVKPTGTPPSEPVGFSQGLASLNTYELKISFKSTGPTSEDSTSISVDEQRSQSQDASYTHMSQSTTKHGEDPSSSDTDMYQIGNDQCSGSGTDWSWTSMPPNQAELLEISKNMLGFTPLIDSPTFVGQENINGIDSNHFSFTVSGLGAKSGAVVNANQGDYWLAVDGQYMVKYSLILETSMQANAEVLHEEISIDLTQVNQPVDVAFPQGCLDASKVTPTP